MKYELGEFTEGKAKGFKYWYPVFEVDNDEVIWKNPITEDMMHSSCDIPEGYDAKLFYIFSMSLKQRVADQVKQRMKPLFDGGASVRLAQLYPDGILNKQETCLTDLLK